MAADRYIRKPEADKRQSRGDAFAGDAWLDTQTGETVYTVVSFNRNWSTTVVVQDGAAVLVSDGVTPREAEKTQRDAESARGVPGVDGQTFPPASTDGGNAAP